MEKDGSSEYVTFKRVKYVVVPDDRARDAHRASKCVTSCIVKLGRLPTILDVNSATRVRTLRRDVSNLKTIGSSCASANVLCQSGESSIEFVMLS